MILQYVVIYSWKSQATTLRAYLVHFNRPIPQWYEDKNKFHYNICQHIYTDPKKQTNKKKPLIVIMNYPRPSTEKPVQDLIICWLCEF